MNMIKNFDKWNSVKKELNSKIDKPPTIHNGEIWWCSVGVNIECEEDGKNDFFDRLRPPWGCPGEGAFRALLSLSPVSAPRGTVFQHDLLKFCHISYILYQILD